MEFTKLVMILFVCGLRTCRSHYRLHVKVHQYPDETSCPNCILNIVLSAPISYGEHSFYTSFISFNTFSSKKKSDMFYSTQYRNNFLPICLLLCGDIHPCPGPVAENSYDTSEYMLFDKRGLHFLHINTRSLLAHLEELRLIAKRTKAAYICITETWLDDTVSD